MKVKVFVKDTQIELNPFVEGYIGHVFSGVVASLKGVKTPRRLEFSIAKRKITISVDDVPIDLAGFAAVIVADTVTATLKHLKGFAPEQPVTIVIDL
jgi:hypothetical protein